MACKICKLNPVIKLTNSEVSLCKKCFIKYFERKVMKTIRAYKLIQKNDRIAVACSGGKDSTSILYILKNLIKDRTIKLEALAIDEGIHGYRNETLIFLKDFCNKNNIKLNIYSFKDEFSKSLDEILKSHKDIPCSICGVLRRYLLNKKAKELGFNKLVTGHNLDDESQSILMNYFKNNLNISARLGPITGIRTDKKFIRRIKPLYFLTEKEVATYAYLKGLMTKFGECPYDTDSYRSEVRDMLNDFESKHGGTKNGIITSFLELLPLLKEKCKSLPEIKTCKICDELCSQDICSACKFAEKIKKN